MRDAGFYYLSVLKHSSKDAPISTMPKTNRFRNHWYSREAIFSCVIKMSINVVMMVLQLLIRMASRLDFYGNYVCSFEFGFALRRQNELLYSSRVRQICCLNMCLTWYLILNALISLITFHSMTDVITAPWAAAWPQFHNKQGLRKKAY